MGVLELPHQIPLHHPLGGTECSAAKTIHIFSHPRWSDTGPGMTLSDHDELRQSHVVLAEPTEPAAGQPRSNENSGQEDQAPHESVQKNRR